MFCWFAIKNAKVRTWIFPTLTCRFCKVPQFQWIPTISLHRFPTFSQNLSQNQGVLSATIANIWSCVRRLEFVFQTILILIAFIYHVLSSGPACWFGVAAQTRQRGLGGATLQTALCMAVVRTRRYCRPARSHSCVESSSRSIDI